MNILQCSFCKKPFQSLGRKVCPACLEQMDKDFFVIRDYIYDHKQTNMDKVAEETGISKQVIMYLLKEGRLELDDKSGGAGLLVCEMCKKSIATGRLCGACKESLAGTMQKSIASKAPPTQDTQNFKGTAKLDR